MHLAIDASNIRQGGGVTHLSQLLSALSLTKSGIHHVTIWVCAETAAQLPDRSWLTKLSPNWVEAGMIKRMLWQQFLLEREMVRRGCEILFSPGGTVPFFLKIPIVTMSQNMLPFEPDEAKRFGLWSWMRLKMWMLRQLQVRSFKKADGVIFLTKYARDTISQWLEQVQNLNALIPHGIEPRFATDVNSQLSVENYSLEEPFTFLYVSILMPYKHQIEVARAASLLRGAGCPLRVKFIGVGWGSYGRQFRKILCELDPKNEFLIWDGGVSFDSIHSFYKESNAFIFASSCENLPNILIEAMANALPIVCSNCGPMPEILKDAGIYFDPSKPQDIAKAMNVLINDSSLRERIALLAKKQSLLYSWERCAKDTFEFIEAVAASHAAKNLSKNLP